VKHLVKRVLLAIPGFQWFCRRLTRRHVRVLMYHRFGKADCPPENRPDAQVLAWQMAAVRAHHPVWTVARHFEAVSGTRPIDVDCPVVVTVDDGYRDFGTVAHPVFAAHGIPVMLFVTTGFVDGQLWLWWDQLAYLFETAAATSLWVEHGGEHHRIDLTSAASRRETWNRIGIRCCFLPEDLKLTLLSTLAEHLDVEIPRIPPERYAPLTWDELRDLHHRGVDVGAHTTSHSILTRVPVARARDEIRGSKRMLEDQLGTAVPWFCYPQGGPADYSPEVVAEVAAAGFSSAYLAFPGEDGPASLLTLSRWGISSDPTEFLWVLCGAARLELLLLGFLLRDTGPGQGYWAGSEAESQYPAQGLSAASPRADASGEFTSST
jgi:peptidoglycan/xylan/chitin deacetylase (PgdA/CDA1 family)